MRLTLAKAVGAAGKRRVPRLRKGRRAVALLTAAGASALLLATGTGSTAVFAAASQAPARPHQVIPAPKRVPSPKDITAAAASTCATAA
jgi:hypothetical protein